MYACIVKNNNDTWDIWSVINDIPFPARKERLESALSSGFPIIGKNLTEYGLAVKNGAIWDGTQFTGGDPTTRQEGSILNLYSYVCNDVIILICIGQPNSSSNEQMAAIFESETTIIKIPEGQTPKIGDIWDGENIISI